MLEDGKVAVLGSSETVCSRRHDRRRRGSRGHNRGMEELIQIASGRRGKGRFRKEEIVRESVVVIGTVTM